MPTGKSETEPLLPAAACVIGARAAWLAALAAERGRSAHTVAAYERDTRQFLVFLARHLGGPPDLAALGALRPADVRAFLADRRREGAGPRSLGRTLAGVRAFFHHLAKHHGVDAGPVRAVRAPSKEPRLPRPVPAEAARAMLAPAADWVEARDAAVFALLYGAGLRVSEATGLDAAALAPPLERLVVRGKGGRERIVPILPAVAEHIERYRAAAPFPLDSGPFFRGEKGGRLSPRIVQRAVERWRHALGLPETATPHALRHAFASHILANGGDLRAIQELLGHARLSTTQIYTAVESGRLLDAWRDCHPRAAR